MTGFVRLAGCNFFEDGLGSTCAYCDTPYAWRKQDAILSLDVQPFVEMVNEFMLMNNLSELCLTGGEPLWNKEIIPAIDMLKDRPYNLTIETNGSLPIWNDKKILWSLDIKCPSSGNSHRNLMANLKKVKVKDQVKFIIGDWEDYMFATEIVTKMKECNIIFQPSYGILKHDVMINWIKHDPEIIHRVRVGMQAHKYWYPEKKRGV
jgi:7-carboxy-7-deazaguanine synthase